MLSVDHVEFYVADAQLAAFFYRTAFGLEPLLFIGPEVGVQDRLSIVLGRGSICLVLTSALTPDHPVARFVANHGDGVRDIALRVPDAREAFARAVERGAVPVEEPHVVSHGTTSMVRASIRAFGEVIHSFIERREGDDLVFAGATQLAKKVPALDPAPLLDIDHIAVCLGAGELDATTAFYERVFGFQVSHVQDVETPRSAMCSKVVESGGGKVKLTFLEPGPKKAMRSQVEEFLEFNRGPGVQHLAFLTADIVETARGLRRVGVSFLHAPDAYYDALEARLGAKGEVSLGNLREYRILADRDDSGFLYQAFTKPVHSRPTFFTEVIQRAGSHGFGGNNVKALFEAIEIEQARRP